MIAKERGQDVAPNRGPPNAALVSRSQLSMKDNVLSTCSMSGEQPKTMAKKFEFARQSAAKEEREDQESAELPSRICWTVSQFHMLDWTP